MNILKKIKRKIYKFFHPRLGVILMLHRVLEQRSTLELNKKIEITPDYLEKTILDYRKKGYRFVSLDEVHTMLEKKTLFTRQPFVCFTFDDGYIDNLEVAYPIFKKYDCPFTIYVTTDFPDYMAVIWWYVLEDIILGNEKIVLSDGREFNCKSLDNKNITAKQIHEFISHLDPKELRNTFDRLFVNYSYSFDEKVRELALSNEQIQQLALDNLCTIASHTVTHPLLSGLNAEQQFLELTESKKKLEHLIHKEIHHFAYPFGNNNDDSVWAAQKAGYKTATLAWGGATRPGQNLWRLTREILKQG